MVLGGNVLVTAEISKSFIAAIYDKVVSNLVDVYHEAAALTNNDLNLQQNDLPCAALPLDNCPSLRAVATTV